MGLLKSARRVDADELSTETAELRAQVAELRALVETLADPDKRAAHDVKFRGKSRNAAYQAETARLRECHARREKENVERRAKYEEGVAAGRIRPIVEGANEPPFPVAEPIKFLTEEERAEQMKNYKPRGVTVEGRGPITAGEVRWPREQQK